MRTVMLTFFACLYFFPLFAQDDGRINSPEHELANKTILIKRKDNKLPVELIQNNKPRAYTFENAKAGYPTFIDLSIEEDPKILDIWRRTGRQPTYVIHNGERGAHPSRYSQAVNGYSSLLGILVDSNGNPMKDVQIKEIPGSSYSSYFRIPSKDIPKSLTFIKKGYSFAPNTFFPKYFSKQEFTFIAHALPLGQELMASIASTGRFDAKADPKGPKLIRHNIEQENEALIFNGFDSFGQFQRDKRFSELDEFTIFLSVKLSPGGSHVQTLFSQDSSFALKIQTGRHLMFTLPGVNDYRSMVRLKNPWKWIDIAITKSRDNTVCLYANGKQVERFRIPQPKPSTKPMLVGNYPWPEPYNGEMRDLMIWNRSMDETQILELFSTPPVTDTFDFKVSKNIWISIGSGILLFIFLISIVFYYFKKRKANSSKEAGITIRKQAKRQAQPTEPITKTNETTICLFGPFSIISSNNEKLKNRFSPKMQEALSFFLINHAFGNQKINPEQIYSALWEDLDLASAKNNRSTLFSKLRKVMAELRIGELKHESGHWLLTLSDDVNCDLYGVSEVFLKGGSTFRNSSEHKEILQTLSKGKLCAFLQSGWVDKYRDELDNLVASKLNDLPETDDHYWYRLLADALQTSDKFSEDGMAYRIRSYILQGQIQKAKEYFKRYKSEYDAVYNTEYEKRFEDFALSPTA
ncbi:hypothetical protein FUAX_48260 (plasmid) [Fulvitalea axinellae]|uniref:Uncharacterized protein n=2 Tax=Fulvitalea axinellae TaxID=1182444 RepID=A0AAU9DD50_9BACT|nr:hypothetical protein FUAX_48260 [Fulvitalea axinellae]